MPRKHVPVSNHNFYHLTARSVNKEPFKIRLEDAWDIFSTELLFLSALREIEIAAFVMMPNHFHLIARTPNRPIGMVMRDFMLGTSRFLNFEANRINQVYGGPYHKSLIGDLRYFSNAYKYVYRNPVASHIVQRAEDYPFSTLPSVIGLKFSNLAIHDEHVLGAQSIDQILSWINKPYSSDKSAAIKAGLRHSTFKFADKFRGKRRNFINEDVPPV